jgi:hypothetical protein
MALPGVPEAGFPPLKVPEWESNGNTLKIIQLDCIRMGRFVPIRDVCLEEDAGPLSVNPVRSSSLIRNLAEAFWFGTPRVTARVSNQCGHGSPARIGNRSQKLIEGSPENFRKRIPEGK